jgi:hypothetical protein
MWRSEWMSQPFPYTNIRLRPQRNNVSFTSLPNNAYLFARSKMETVG